MDAGLSIGKQIRQRGYATLVGAKLCASACALAWLGGAHRYMQRDSRIGFHAAYVQNGEYVRETGMGNALIGAYLSKLGLGDSAIVYMTVSPPEYLNWLDLQSARDLGIDVLLYEDGTVTAVGPSNVRPSENAKRAVRGFFDRYKESGMSGVMVSVEKCYERTASLKSLKSIEYCVELDWCAAYIDEATAKQMKWPKTEYFLAENVSKRFRQASSSLDWQGKMPSQLFEQWKSMAEKVVDGGSISR